MDGMQHDVDVSKVIGTAMENVTDDRSSMMTATTAENDSDVTTSSTSTPSSTTLLTTLRHSTASIVTALSTRTTSVIKTSNDSISPTSSQLHDNNTQIIYPFWERQPQPFDHYYRNLKSTFVILSLFIVFPVIFIMMVMMKHACHRWHAGMDKFYHKSRPVQKMAFKTVNRGSVAPILFPIPPEMLNPNYKKVHAAFLSSRRVVQDV